MEKKTSKNILGTNLISCCLDPVTGYFRDGFCNTDLSDQGTHIVCAIMTSEFLNYSALKGNDLITPKPQWQFPGLKAGDKWCLCINRWLEAVDAGKAPKIVLESCHKDVLLYANLELLEQYQFKE